MTKFSQQNFLIDHIRSILNFYDPICIDKKGGFYHFFKDDGKIYDSTTRHLVSSTRFVFNYAMAYMEFGDPKYLEFAQHGLEFLESAHKKNQGYAWLLQGDKVLDDTNHAYGLAFVLLANAVSLKAGIESAFSRIESIWQLLEDFYWQQDYGLYIDEYNGDFSKADKYRGQNANMHMCEALLMCFEATQDTKFLSRAKLLTYNITVIQANKTDGLIWEHYDENWEVDWNYNKDNPKHLFRPWGFQSGHQTEWSKLLLILHRLTATSWMLTRAEELFLKSVTTTWDDKYGGLCYGFAPDKSICDSDKYFWVQAESLAAAKLLYIATGKDLYENWYNRLWQYSWDHMICHQFGGWYRILDNKNNKYSDEKSPAGKTDYHTMGACYEVLRALRDLRYQKTKKTVQ